MRFIVTMLLLTCSVEAQTAKSWFDQGMQAGNKGNFRLAIDNFTRAIQADPNFVDAYYYRAQAKRSLNDQDGSIPDLNKCLQLQPMKFGCLFQRAEAYRFKGDLNSAIRDSDLMIAAMYLNEIRVPIAFVERGAVLRQMGKDRGSQADFEYARIEAERYHNSIENALRDVNALIQQSLGEPKKGTYVEPKIGPNPMADGKRLIDAGDYRIAIANFDDIIKRDQNNEEAHFLRGLAQHRLSQWAVSLENMNIAVRLKPADATAWRYAGLNHFMLGQDEMALQAYNAAIQHDPKYAEAYMNRAELYRTMKPVRHMQAIQDWTAALKIMPNNAKLLNGRAMSYHASGQTNLAIADLNAAIKAAPNLAIPYCNLGVIYGDLGRKDEEQRWYAKCYSLDAGEKSFYDGQRNWLDAYLAWQRYLASIMPKGGGGSGASPCARYQNGLAADACRSGNEFKADRIEHPGIFSD